MSSVPEARQQSLSASLTERRYRYRCGDRFVTLDSIPTWLEHCRQNGVPIPDEAAAAPADNSIAEKVSFFRGDITALEIDAIVNAANSSLLGGGGVDGAIHGAAGPRLKAECATLNGCRTGDAKITAGYNLPARYVIHTVGPRGEQPAQLRSCYNSCLQLARREQLRSVAFPCVATGVYGYPNEAAARVALQVVREQLSTSGQDLDRVIFCLYLEKDVTAYMKLLPVFFPVNL